MKISLIGPVYPYRGGIAHFTTVLAQQLIVHKHEVQVISFKSQYPKWLYPGKSDKDFSSEREQVPASYLLTPTSPVSWQQTAHSLLQYEPDLVIFPWWVTIWGPAFSSVLRRLSKAEIPTCFLIHNTIPHEAKPWDRFITRRVFAAVDSFLVMTEKEKTRLLTLFPDAPHIQVAPHPVLQLFKPPEDPSNVVRSRLGLPTDVPILLFFGFVRPYKGLRILIHALKILVDQGAPAYLLVVGEFWEDIEAYRNLISDLDLTERVHIVDSYIPDQEVGDYFIASNLLVAPYVSGTQSAALKSALGVGLPVVVTDVVTDNLIEDLPDRCRVVASGDPDALAQGIKDQLAKPMLRMAQVADHFDQSWGRMVNIIEKLGSSVISHGTRSE